MLIKLCLIMLKNYNKIADLQSLYPEKKHYFQSIATPLQKTHEINFFIFLNDIALRHRIHSLCMHKLFFISHKIIYGELHIVYLKLMK